MLDSRKDRIRNLIRKRQSHFSVILENVRDPHNIGAVLRTCDAVGIREVFMIYPDENKNNQFILGKRASSGARKWVDVFEFNSVKTAIDAIRQKGYEQIWATKILPASKSLYEIDFTQKIALLFGNEHLGVTDEAAGYADGNFIIPQVGMVQSLNISVACAVSLYEGYRQRNLKGYYSDSPTIPMAEQDQMFEKYAEREKIRFKGKHSIKINN
ncbi:MAG: RNA methyltransferase [Saprospiraceae bacterium]